MRLSTVQEKALNFLKRNAECGREWVILQGANDATRGVLVRKGMIEQRRRSIREGCSVTECRLTEDAKAIV